MKLRLIGAAMALGLSVVGVSQSADALTINRNFTGGIAPVSAVGGGSLQNIFNHAADLWEQVIQDSHVVDINFSWAALGGSTLGVHSLTGQGGIPNRETSANIRFDNDGSSVFFLDATPGDDTEYATQTVSSADLGGGTITTGNVFTGALGLAAGRTDLLTVALHEIGHALGMSSANTSFQAENVDSDIDVLAGMFAGTGLPTDSGAHLDISSSLLFPSIGTGTRKYISEADLLANCQVSQFTNCSLNPTAEVSEPGALVLLGLGIAGLGFARRRKAA